MKLLKFVMLFCNLIFFIELSAQSIADFTSITPAAQTSGFVLPTSHTFQRIIKVGDPLTVGGVTMLTKPDFTAFVPIATSSINGYLCINSEDGPVAFGGTGGGGVTVLDISFNESSKLWETLASQRLDFTLFGGTASNCSGTVTPWGTVISSEEVAFIPGALLDNNNDLYNDVGWNVEIDPANKTVLGKHWAMGNMEHENVTIHSNERTVYQGADSDPGYLYKFVANNAKDLSSGNLYVYSGSKSGIGAWAQIANTSKDDRNNTIALSAAAGGTVFDGVEDVEIGPDGMVYFAVKNERRVYRFLDSDVLETSTSTVSMETYVGGMSYNINDGTSTTAISWGPGNDNLAFDGQGNLWVLQDGANNYIWVVKNGHTQQSPNVELFGSAPLGSEPTGITFTPDYKYLFMSLQFYSDPVTNNANQIDAAGNTVNFNKGTTLVVALKDNLGSGLSLNEFSKEEVNIYPNPLNNSKILQIRGLNLKQISVYSILGEELLNKQISNSKKEILEFHSFKSGLYLLKINDYKMFKIVVK